jgi:DNA polymerase III delta prime subunit
MTTNSKHQLWCEKYRPQTLADYVFHDEAHKRAFSQMVEDRTIPHLLLSGVQGSGKTTIAQILINELGFESTDVKVINASDENSVDNMRDKIKNFISTFAMGEFKIVLLEEADYLSQPAQAVLRKYMENENVPARFILTCNYDNKLMPAIKSRAQHYRFKAGNKNEIAEFCAKILINEGIEFDLDKLDKYVAFGYPDIRKIINLLQQNSVSGHLMNPQSEAEAGDYKFALLDLIAADKWNDARILACGNVSSEEWDGVYRFLYENLDKSEKFKDKANWEAGIVSIANHLYKNSIVADPEINAAAMFIELAQV